MRSAAPRVISFVLAVSALAAVSSASGAASAANLGVNVVVGTTHGARPDVVLNGASVTVKRLDFIAGMAVEDVGPEPADVHVRLELPAGLRWGADLPDPSESCTSTPTTGDCTPATLDPDNNNRSTGWGWDVIADAPGTYVLKTSVVSSSKADPDLSDNVATATVVVQPASTAAVAATAARVLPARPRAGSVVVARVGVTAGGNPVRASAATCAATVGAARTRTTVRVTTGAVTCSLRTPRSAHGKVLRGTIAFSVQATRVARAFSARLR